jgi:hypothetical protein
MAYDEAKGLWVGPFKRLVDLARFFLGPYEAAARPRPVVIGVPTTKGRTVRATPVDLREKKSD